MLPFVEAPSKRLENFKGISRCAAPSYRSRSAGIALLYSIKGFVQVAPERFEFAAIDGGLISWANPLDALFMDADRHRALVRDLPVHLEAEQACDNRGWDRDDPKNQLFHKDDPMA